MRRSGNRHLFLTGSVFQYRERVDPFAAQQVNDRFDHMRKVFQYRERVDPFAAETGPVY